MDPSWTSHQYNHNFPSIPNAASVPSPSSAASATLYPRYQPSSSAPLPFQQGFLGYNAIPDTPDFTGHHSLFATPVSGPPSFVDPESLDQSLVQPGSSIAPSQLFIPPLAPSPPSTHGSSPLIDTSFLSGIGASTPSSFTATPASSGLASFSLTANQPFYPTPYYSDGRLSLPSALPQPFYPHQHQHQQQQLLSPPLSAAPFSAAQTKQNESEALAETLRLINMTTELQSIMSDLSYLTVDKLKLAIRRMNESAATNLRMSGLKQELMDRIKHEVLLLSREVDRKKFLAVRTIIRDVKDGISSPASATYGSYAHQPYVPPGYPSYPTPQPAYQTPYYNASSSSSLPAPRFNPPPPTSSNSVNWTQRIPSSSASTAASAATAGDILSMKFRTSPFYEVVKGVGTVGLLPRAPQGDRKSVGVSFGIDDATRGLLTASRASPTNPQYQLRLYCTNEDYFSPSRPSAAQLAAPIDFPGTCEIKVNGLPVSANTKGIKKVLGSAPPVDLGGKGGGGVNLTPGAVNRVEVVYINSEKRYYMAAFLVKVSSVKQVVEQIKKGKVKTKEEVVAHIIKQNSDPDVEATAYGLSLKDPLTFARIKTPIRSAACSHIGCYDAETFFMMMEQTPSWSCPICSKTVKVEEIIVDGFFESVLKACPSSVDEVTIEPDGTWRSSDSRYGTARSVTASLAGTPVPVSAPGSVNNGSGKGKGKAVDQDALTLDSDDDDDFDYEDDAPLAARRQMLSLGSSSPALSNGVAGEGGGGGGGKKAAEVIDLTLSDSDDEAPPRPSVVKRTSSASVNHLQPSEVLERSYREHVLQANKRKAEEEEEARKRHQGEGW